MVLSTHHNGGGTLHLPSPTHCRSIDPAAALVQIRRSLSRSPSRRSLSPKLGSPKLGSPLSPSPSSPNLRSHALAHSPLAIPYPPSAKKARSTIRKTSPMRATHHAANNRKLALEESNDQGNGLSHSTSIFSLGQENSRSTTPEGPPPFRNIMVDSGKQTPPLGECDMQVPNQVFSRKDRHELFSDAPVRSSPLKRTDRSNNSDASQSGSPSAKRRSLHGASFGPDFNIFDQYAALEASTGAGSATQESTTITTMDSNGPSFSPVPKRGGSLRKATLQQRYEKPMRLRTAMDNGSDAQTANPVRSRLRLSVDGHSQATREPLASSQTVVPSASLQPAAANRRDPGNQSQRHPLSRTITQSSSGSSFAEDSPTHVPIRQPQARRARLDFTKSLPLHAARPVDSGSGTSSQESAYATPQSYKLAKPLPAAFMSTGLISKKNRNLDQEQLDAKGSIGHMPDTPCKRPVSFASISPSAGFPVNKGPSRQNRHTMHSFGTPSTPFYPHVAGLDVGIGQGTGVFGGSFNNGSSRRGSFLAEDIPSRPSPSYNSSARRSGSRIEVPPTPTKQASLQIHNPSFSFRSNLTVAPSGNALSESRDANQDASIPVTSIFESSSEEESEATSNWDDVKPPFSIQRQRSFSSNDLFEGDAEGPSHTHSPTPKTRKYNTVPLSRRRGNRNPPFHQQLTSPNFERSTRISPKTPADMIPPDPSGLSISANAKSQSFFADTLGYSGHLLPPVTPTANRDSFPRVSHHRSTLTPVHHSVSAEVDESITARFDKAELVGTGEFSSVFRVMRQCDPDSGSSGYFSRFNGGDTQRTQRSTRTWAVKKTRTPYLGQRDRLRKLQEVEILKQLGRSDHTIHLADSWEYAGHLYIQTEYCDEGSLDVFLDRVGRSARLDDFRIWKVLLELAQGLQHIHDSSVIHLDLKPANILITFEGVLKIADFGMATCWPAASGIEGEGDREYIAPEILRGKFDKPADIFALGLIMLEIAGNVMLPENGVSWQRLRSGDMSDVPSLTSSSLGTSVSRDASGQPLTDITSSGLLRSGSFSEDPIDSFGITHSSSFTPQTNFSSHHPGRAGELLDPPKFMKDSTDVQALDSLVRWMINPEPDQRPRASQLLTTVGVSWVKSRRRAGATVYEGNWGPADDVLQDDAEMIDV